MIERLAVLSQSGTIEVSDLPERLQRRSVAAEQTDAASSSASAIRG